MDYVIELEMKPVQLTKPCAVCHDFFIPDPRVGKRQFVYQKLSCQPECKRRAQKRWLSQNPGYFTERYPYVKAWPNVHPGYLKQYRANKKALLEQRSADIQDEIAS